MNVFMTIANNFMVTFFTRKATNSALLLITKSEFAIYKIISRTVFEVFAFFTKYNGRNQNFANPKLLNENIDNKNDLEKKT